MTVPPATPAVTCTCGPHDHGGDQSDECGKVGQPADCEDPGREQQHHCNHADSSDAEDGQIEVGGERIRDTLICGPDRPPTRHGVLDESDIHHDCCSAEAPVEALPAPQCIADERPDQSAQVDAHVVDGESTVATLVAARVEGAQDHLGRGLHRAGTDRDRDQSYDHSDDPWDDRQADVAEHDQDGRVEQGPFRRQDPVSHPCAEHAGEVDQPAVGTHDGYGDALVDTETAFADGVVEVVDEDCLESVVAEPLPHLHPGQRGQSHGMAEECPFGESICGG